MLHSQLCAPGPGHDRRGSTPGLLACQLLLMCIVVFIDTAVMCSWIQISACWPVGRPAHLSVRLSVCVSACLSVCLLACHLYASPTWCVNCTQYKIGVSLALPEHSTAHHSVVHVYILYNRHCASERIATIAELLDVDFVCKGASRLTAGHN